MTYSLGLWKENLPLIIQICKDEKLKYKIHKESEYSDIDGNTVSYIEIERMPSTKSIDYYNKHRIRK